MYENEQKAFSKSFKFSGKYKTGNIRPISKVIVVHYDHTACSKIGCILCSCHYHLKLGESKNKIKCFFFSEAMVKKTVVAIWWK